MKADGQNHIEEFILGLGDSALVSGQNLKEKYTC